MAANDSRVTSVEASAPSSPASARTPIRTSIRRPLSRVARRPPTDAGRSTLSLVPSARVGTPRTARLLASLLLVALLVSAGGVRAEPGPPPDRPWPLSPAAVALAQKRAVERLA